MNLDLTGLSGLGTGAIILVLVFRTLWRQDDRWNTLLDAERTAAGSARDDAAAARAAAKAAQEDAVQARREAHEARVATQRCEAEHEATRLRLDGLVEHLVQLGLPMPKEASNGEGT